jgi:hypothetical protein
LAPTDRLAPGEVAHVILVGVDRAQAAVLLSYVTAMFQAPALRPLVVRETAETLELRRVRVQVMTSNFRIATYGRWLPIGSKAVVDQLDEAPGSEVVASDVGTTTDRP